MRRVFISDLHLEDPNAPAFVRFSECLEAESHRNDEIVIVGDLVEMWIGDDDDATCATALTRTLASASANCRVLLMHGNRDFLFAKQFATRTGITLLPDPFITSDGILVTHGDRYCTDDIEYQNMRAFFRSDAWQADILSKTLAERKALGQMLREQSKNSNANKAANIMDVNREVVAQEADQHSARVVVHGHTHRPGLHCETNFARYVLGAWEGVGWLCRQHDSDLTLECFSLAHRYGT